MKLVFCLKWQQIILSDWSMKQLYYTVICSSRVVFWLRYSVLICYPLVIMIKTTSHTFNQQYKKHKVRRYDLRLFK